MLFLAFLRETGVGGHYQEKQRGRQSRDGRDPGQGRVARQLLPSKIALFWAVGDDIMTDGDEGEGAEGRKRYQPAAAPALTHKRTSKSSRHRSLPITHKKQDKPLMNLGSGGGCHLKVRRTHAHTHTQCYCVFMTEPVRWYFLRRSS